MNEDLLKKETIVGTGKIQGWELWPCRQAGSSRWLWCSRNISLSCLNNCLPLCRVKRLTKIWRCFVLHLIKLRACSFNLNRNLLIFYEKKIWNRVDCQHSEKTIQNTQEIKRTLFHWTKQGKTCTFFRRSSFHTMYNIKSWINCLFFCSYVVRSLKKRISSKMCTFCPVSFN